MRCIGVMSILEIIRLWEQGLSQREIAASVNCGKSTVNDVQQRCQEADLTYAQAAEMTNAAIRARLYPAKTEPTKKEGPDWDAVQVWLKGGKRRNLRYAWEEYRLGQAEGLSYSQYCKRYRQWREASGAAVTMIQHHEPGKELYMDWMGDTLDCVSDSDTGQLQTAHFFVAALGCSGYPYVEAFPDEGMESWLSGNVHTLEHIGGVPRIIIPDNCKTAVTKANYYDPKLNPTYLEMAKYYEVAIIPTRVCRPKDKSIVEGSVGWLETWLVEWLRGQRFFSFGELNREIVKRVKSLSERPFQNRPGSRMSVYEELDRPALRPLPPTRFEHVVFVSRRVPDNYHVEYEGFYYSVPYTLYKQEVTLRATATMIEVVGAERERVAMHLRRQSGSRYVTETAHMPEKHRRQLDNNRRTGRDYLQWASSIGENTRMVIERILGAQRIEEVAYRPCMGVLQCAKKFGVQKLEEACGHALRLGNPCYTTVRSLLQTSLPEKRQCPLPSHENLRNPAEFA